VRLFNIRSLRLTVSLFAFAALVSGCFQTAGAALDATVTPPGGAVIVAVASASPTTQVAPPTAISPTVIIPSATNTAQPGLLFASQTPLPVTPSQAPATDISITANVDFSTLTPASTVAFGVVVTNSPLSTLTPYPTATSYPTYTPYPTFTSQPTFTPFPSSTPTEPIIITPTRKSSVTATKGGISVAIAPTNNARATGIAIAALTSTSASLFNAPGQTQTQAALNAQAAANYQTATMGAMQQQTLVATSLGTFGAPVDIGTVPPTPGSGLPPTVPPTVAPVLVSGTPQGTPGVAGSGAAGTITGDCIYSVVQGDRLFRIALRFNLTPYQLAFANNLINPDLIVPGQTLRVPNCTGSTPGSVGVGSTPGTGAVVTTVAGSTGSGTATGGSYMVIDGDTLYGIAMRYHVRVISLAQTNSISNLSLIYIGQMLNIPGQ